MQGFCSWRIFCDGGGKSNEFIRKLKIFMAFSLKRRKSAWIGFSDDVGGKFIFWLFRTFYRQNIHFYTDWDQKLDSYKVMAFIFRDRQKLEKFLKAEKMNWQDHFAEKTKFLGEALDYPSFAIKDFIRLTEARDKDNDGEVKFGDRIGVYSYDYGWDGFVFKPENLPKIEQWCIENKIPLKKSHFQIYETELLKWRELSPEELAELREMGKVSLQPMKPAK